MRYEIDSIAAAVAVVAAVVAAVAVAAVDGICSRAGQILTTTRVSTMYTL